MGCTETNDVRNRCGADFVVYIWKTGGSNEQESLTCEIMVLAMMQAEIHLTRLPTASHMA